ncbi:nonribosomal peptide synthetase [Colletotrichum tofieldiae]|uniref:Nonribosomal peptide synthetase n=1 Tax=Colletotrichum tofieldiae TaxID=708197 RepID=A0A161YGV7_9PEZI|nr:nonribosomal peptide synthetase [Colletotrichum tofieldiae]
MEAPSDPELEISKPNLQNLAYVISTSGSTGKPKIVAIPQIAISSALSAQVVGYKLDESSRVAQFASYVFDSSILEIFGTLLAGGCVCVPSEEERMSDFAGFVQRMDVNLLDVTPSLMRTLSPADVPSVKVLSLGGEALNQSDVDTWAPHTYLINTYGPSEASVNAAISHRLLPDSDASNVGFGVGCKLWVVDPANHNLLAPIGAVGELLIDGPILASGYFEDDAETSRAFVSDVAWQQEEIFRGNDKHCGAAPRLYKTGDLVRYNVDGSLNFLGRRDAQIKVRGYRIERQEVEHQIRSIPGIEHVAVFDGKEGFCKGKLVAVVSMRRSDDSSGTKDRENDASELWQLYEPEKIAATARFEQSIRRQLASPLPTYMIPDLLLITKRLPLLVSYKVDLKTIERAVYDMDKATFRRVTDPGFKGDSNTKPGTELEERLRQIWEKVLEVDEANIDLDESFFALGGDSVTAMKVTHRCRESGLHMMTHDLLAGRTIRGLATRILNRSMNLHPPDINSGGGTEISPHVFGLLSVAAQDVDSVVPATPFQNQVYYASRMHPGKPYFATYLAEITTDDSNSYVDVNKFSRAWQSVVDRHPIMRTLFMVNPSDGTLYQIALREARAQIETRQVEDGTEVAKRLWADHHAFSQELTTDPTSIRPRLAHQITISRARSGAIFLSLSLSHLLTDTVALEHMFSDLDAFYKGASPNKPSVAFADYAKWFETHAVTANNKIWQEQFLRGAQSCHLLQPRNRPLVDNLQPIHEVSLPFSISSSQQQAISDFCRAAQVTVPNLFLFCWGLLLKRYTQQNSVCFGQLVAGRDAPVTDLEDVVGPVLNVLPVHVDLSPSSAPLLELMQQFQKTNSEAMVNQPCSLKSIEKLMGCSTDRGLFNTIVNIRKVHYQEKDLEPQPTKKSLQFRLVEKHDASEYDFVLQVDEKGGSTSGALTFWNHQFEFNEVKGLLDAYLVILETVLRSLDATASGVFSKLEKCHR